MKTFTRVLGFASDREIAAKLHDLSHEGKVEYLLLDRNDAPRKRLRAKTDKGTECLIALPRNEGLGEGAVLELGGQATVVRMNEERWLTVEAFDQAAALELGYFCGNLHWRVRFDDKRIQIALEGPEEDYLTRLDHLIATQRARPIADD
jgi:urease accessory protein